MSIYLTTGSNFPSRRARKVYYALTPFPPPKKKPQPVKYHWGTGLCYVDEENYKLPNLDNNMKPASKLGNCITPTVISEDNVILKRH